MTDGFGYFPCFLSLPGERTLCHTFEITLKSKATDKSGTCVGIISFSGEAFAISAQACMRSTQGEKDQIILNFHGTSVVLELHLIQNLPGSPVNCTKIIYFAFCCFQPLSRVLIQELSMAQ